MSVKDIWVWLGFKRSKLPGIPIDPIVVPTLIPVPPPLPPPPLPVSRLVRGLVKSIESKPDQWEFDTTVTWMSPFKHTVLCMRIFYQSHLLTGVINYNDGGQMYGRILPQQTSTNYYFNNHEANLIEDAIQAWRDRKQAIDNAALAERNAMFENLVPVEEDQT
jgi:hypothetical protein